MEDRARAMTKKVDPEFQALLVERNSRLLKQSAKKNKAVEEETITLVAKKAHKRKKKPQKTSFRPNQTSLE